MQEFQDEKKARVSHTKLQLKNLRGKDCLRDARRKIYGTIKMDYREIQCHGVTWINLALNRDKRQDLVNMSMSLRGTVRVKNFFTTSATVSVSERTPSYGMSQIIRKARTCVQTIFVCDTFSSVGRLQHPRRNEKIASNSKTRKRIGKVKEKDV